MSQRAAATARRQGQSGYRRRFTRRPGTATVAVLVGGILAACQGEEAPGRGPLAGVALTFSISLALEERAAVRALLDRFETESGARVKLVSVTSEDLPEKLAVEVGSGRPTIDLFAQDNLALRVLVDRGLVQDLAEVPAPEGVRPALAPPRLDGGRFFLPFRPNVRVTYVNRARFRQAGVEPPSTVDELDVVARRLRSAADGTGKITLSLAEGGATAVTVSEWIVAFGGDPLALNDAGSVQALERLQALWADGLLARESLLAKYDTEVDYLQGETAWLAQNWPFTSTVLAEQDLLDRFRVYAGWRGPARAAHVVGGDVLGVPRGVTGRRREGALALARFLVSREAQQLLVERNGWPSIRGDAYATVPPALRETFEAIERALAAGWHRPPVPHWPEVSEALNEAVRRVLQRGEPVRPVLDELSARVADAARRPRLSPARAPRRRPGIMPWFLAARSQAHAGRWRPGRAGRWPPRPGSPRPRAGGRRSVAGRARPRREARGPDLAATRTDRAARDGEERRCPPSSTTSSRPSSAPPPFGPRTRPAPATWASTGST